MPKCRKDSTYIKEGNNHGRSTYKNLPIENRSYPNFDSESINWILSQIHLVAFFARTNTVLDMMVIVKHTPKSVANTLNSVDMTYDFT